MLTEELQIRKNQRYWVRWAGDFRQGKVIEIVRQRSATLIRWRVGRIPWISPVTTESVEDFLKRLA